MAKISMAAARVSAGFTQAEMAEKMGVSRQSIIDWENGKRQIKTAYFHMFCQLTGFSVDDIFLPAQSTESKR